MEVYISINGVLRNLIQKFDYHYRDCYIDAEFEGEDQFEYKVTHPVYNDDLLKYYTFHEQKEYDNFLYLEYPLEIFGHAGISYPTAFTDINKLILGNPDINFTLVGLDELGKARPSTFFFLSKNQFLGNNIRFIRSKDIENEWEKCDVWITDEKRIVDSCPKNKKVIKFKTDYNQFFTCETEINNLINFDVTCLKF